MSQESSGPRADLPDDVDPAAVLAFRPRYGAKHPLWTSDACQADLDALRLPADLTSRLQRWSQHFEVHRDYDEGWIGETPEPWWLNERDALPLAIATLFGRITAVRVPGGYVHSDQPAASTQAVAALARVVLAITDEAAPPEASTVEAAGTSFAFIAGRTSTSSST